MGVYQVGKSWYIDFYYDGKRYKESVGAVNRTIAKEKLIIRKREVIQGQYKPKAVQVAFDKFKEQYLEYSEGNKRPGSYLRDENSLKHLSRFFGGKRISDISPFLIEKYKMTRQAEKAAPGTINRELGCLRHMLNIAIKWGKAQANPFGKVRFLKEPKGKDRILSPEEESVLMEAIRTGHKAGHLAPIVITALNTGMRKGEILNLKWGNVDFPERYITVEGTKNGEIRKIPMNKVLTSTLKNVKRASRGEYVFSRGCGTPYGDIKRGWWTALESAGIENFRFHDLRHTFGSRLGMAGVDIKTIQELMGHKDIKMTMRYSHPTPEHKRNAVEILERSHTIFHTTPEKQIQGNVVSIGNK
ncbi:MAG: tyrosine-type recombinase/integrase [Deltaproteobacteria bacterium]|nr:tyrosine-type recombinase/integrase [Deltaproteobacteria bacterium]